MAVFRVRITGLNKKYEMRTFLPELDEFLVFGDIIPEIISRWYPPISEIKKATERFNKFFKKQGG